MIPVFHKGTCITELIRRKKPNYWPHSQHTRVRRRWREVKKQLVGRNKMQSSGGIAHFLFLLCAQSQSWEWDAEGERPWDWDDDKILTWTGYLKPLTFFHGSTCWKKASTRCSRQQGCSFHLKSRDQAKWSQSKIHWVNSDSSEV